MKRNLIALTLAGAAGLFAWTAYAADWNKLSEEERIRLAAAQNCDAMPSALSMTAKARRDLQLLVSVEAGWSPEVVRAIHRIQ